jgi:hypothetical protein
LTGAGIRLLGSLGAALLLAAVFVQQVTASRLTSAVVDEPPHLTAGYLSLVHGDLSVNREHPPLLKALAALPLLWMDPILPAFDPSGPRPGTEDFEFQYSRSFLYRSNDADRLLAAARLPMILLTLLLGSIVFVWARELAGTPAGLAALVLFAFHPGILAHGSLVTTDLGAAFLALSTLWALRLTVRRGSLVAAAACGLLLGLSLLSKFSTLLLLPIGLLLALADRILPFPVKGELLRKERISGERLAILGAVVVCTAWLILLAGYGFDGFPLPRLYVEGIGLAQLKNATVEGPTYLMGEISPDGYWSYYLIALAVKSPVPFLILASTGAALWIARRGRWREAAWLLVPPAAWIGAMTVMTRAQIGVRYILPAIPFLCVAAGSGIALLVRDLARGEGGAGSPSRGAAVAAGSLIILLLAWQALSTLGAHPHYLSYFNGLAGGSERGWRWLADSNLDWGQELAALRRWQVESGEEPVNLFYFGTADPDYHGIRRHPYGEAKPGWFAVSATHLVGVYLSDRDYLADLREMEPDARIGGSIFLYRLERVPPRLRRPLTR